MRGTSTGHLRSRPCSGKKTLRRCRNEEADNVILIDVDSNHFDNVIIIDVPDSLPKKRKGSSKLRKDKKQPLQSIIYIDDDESPEKFHSFAGASSSRSFMPPTNDFEDVDAEENPFIQENVTPVRLSKCKRTYSGKASAGEVYGLNLDSENNSSANDHPDCELMEDISGKVQEQWEKAFYRRKKGIENGQSGMRNQNGASRIIIDDGHQTVGRKGENDEHMEAPYHSHTGKFSNEDEGTPLSKEEDGHCSSTYASVGGSKHSPSIHAEQEDHKHYEPGSSSGHHEKIFKNMSSYSSHSEQETKEVKKTKLRANGNSDYCKASSVEDDVDISKCRNSFEVEVDSFQFFPTDEFRKSQATATRCDNEMEHLESCDPHESGRAEKTYNLTSDEFLSNRDGEEDKDADFHTKNGRTVDSVESCMIGERERFKETDEYKRAMEEEWASRQQVLKLQAEEAQNLRRLQKRRKAEGIRLLDMERRQKERIEEMRSTKKKDEENLNLKEEIRGEVRKELNKLEMACQNMASLLHSFGIQIEGWPNPSRQEVQTAYKKALLTFHPDRASRSDIRQQVEAEEKFKLINRFKEKYSSVL